MRKIYITLITILSIIQFAHAQWITSGSNIYNSNTGNVGIGTTNPVSTLHLQGTFVSSGTVANLGYPNALNLNFLANSAQMLIGWNRSWGNGETDFIANQGPGFTGGFAFYNHNNSNIETQLMWITGSGQVLIGTNTPVAGYNLQVNGSAIATSVTVQAYNSWPDYVFKPKYHLPTLTEVKTYIDQNQHLSEIPSAAQIEKDGLNLGDMDKVLLKKVEELTLYLIEKEKEIKMLQALNDQQKEINQSIQKEINELKQQMSTLIKTKK